MAEDTKNEKKDEKKAANGEGTALPSASATGSGTGSGGDVGSGPTGGITTEDVSESNRRPVVMSGAAFALGLISGLLIGWFLSD